MLSATSTRPYRSTDVAASPISRDRLRAVWQRVASLNYAAAYGVLVRIWQRMVRRPLLASALAVATLLSVGAILLAAGTFDVQRVTVDGASRATSVRIQALARGVLGDSMLTVNTSALRKRVAEIPQVATVQVTRSWPNKLRVEVVERHAAFVVHRGDGWLLVDQSATPYLTVPRPPAHVLPLTVPEASDASGTSAAAQSTAKAPLRAAVAVVDALPPDVRRSVVAVDAPSANGIRLRMRGGATVVWGGPEDSVRKARALAVLLRRDAHVYDVSTLGLVTTS